MIKSRISRLGIDMSADWICCKYRNPALCNAGGRVETLVRFVLLNNWPCHLSCAERNTNHTPWKCNYDQNGHRWPLLVLKVIFDDLINAEIVPTFPIRKRLISGRWST